MAFGCLLILTPWSPPSLYFSTLMWVGYEISVVSCLIQALTTFLRIIADLQLSLDTSSFLLPSYCRINHPAGIYAIHSLSGFFWYDPVVSVSLVVLNFSWGVSLVFQGANSFFPKSWDLWRGPSCFVLRFAYSNDWGFFSFRILGIRVMFQHIQIYLSDSL